MSDASMIRRVNNNKFDDVSSQSSVMERVGNFKSNNKNPFDDISSYQGSTMERMGQNNNNVFDDVTSYAGSQLVRLGDTKSPFDDLKSDNGSNTSYMQTGGTTNVTFGVHNNQIHLENS